MEMYVVGVYKNGKSISGFKILGVNADGTTQTKDVDYNAAKSVVRSGLAKINNLCLDKNDELKGVNGSLDRYGVVGKSQALVIIDELRDNNGKTVGYFCSDTNGQTRSLNESQVFMFADKFSIANGKVVPDGKGGRHLSTIEGSYNIARVAQKQQQAQKPQQTQPQQTQTNQEQKTQQTQQINASALPQDVIDLINKVKARPEYKNSFAKKIVDTVERHQQCSEKQKATLERSYNEWLNPSSIKLPQDVEDLIKEIKTYKEYKGSHAELIVKTVEERQRCSDKQKAAIQKELDRFKKASKPQQTQTQQVQAKAQPVQQPQQTQKQPQQAVQPTTPAQQQPQNTQIQQPVQPVKTQQPAQPVNNTSTNYSKNIAKTDRTIREEKRKFDEETLKEQIEAARKTMNARAKRANTQNIQSDGLFDYSLHRNGTAYIEGFTEDAETPEDLVIPEIAIVNDKQYKVTGITVEAFSGEHIVTVVTSQNIIDIGQFAFAHCAKLKRADLSKSKHTMIPSKCFLGCVSLKEVLPGNYIQRVHEYGFAGCKSLTSITLPSSCETVARCAFEADLSLKECHGSIKMIDYGGFNYCESLDTFDFGSVNTIGPHAFRNTGFRELVLPGNIRSIGEKAFADCLKLQKVTINEGVSEIQQWAFAKSDFESVAEGNPDNMSNIKLDDVYTPKSLTMVAVGAFRNVGMVHGYTGSVAESKCIASQTPFHRLDSINLENSTSTRIKSTMVGKNAVEGLMAKIDSPVELASNPEYKMNEKKLINVALNDELLGFLGLSRTTEVIEPHIKFKAMVNYLQDVSNIMQLPLLTKVYRLRDTYYVLKNQIYDDGCNAIYKVTYQIMDTMEEGSFIIVMMNNNLRYITDCNLYTNIVATMDITTDEQLPVKEYLHAGDIIGEESTISGSSGVLVDSAGIKRNVGFEFYQRLYKNGFSIYTTKRDDVLYIPAAGRAINLHDRRGDNLAGEDKIETESKSLIEMFDYDGFIKYILSIKKNVGGSRKFFEDMGALSDKEVAKKIKYLATIDDEKEAQLFRVSKAFHDIVYNSGNVPNPNLMTLEIFKELSTSYWMISKDETWLRQTGSKSLNQTAVFHIGSHTLTEYKSNQIVKFSNPYMNGKKGAYIFTLQNGRTLVGVYASRYNMQTIADKLYNLTNIKSDTVIPNEIMKDPYTFDSLNADLFYNFYDVLYSKGGWAFNAYNSYGAGSYNAQFNISMYKPNGIFYLTLSRVGAVKTREGKTITAFKTIPVLPIGNMDRALMVATTTNTNAKNTKLFDELMNLAAYIQKQDRLLYVREQGKDEEIGYTYNNYVEARKLVMSGVKDVAEYKKLISDRAVYMLGTVHTGTLQREKAQSEEVEDIDEILEDIAINDDIDSVDLSDINSESSDDEIIIEDNQDEEEIDFDDDSDGEEFTFEQFFKTAKSMGVTDEAQARAMYINFKSTML
jgi:hypothetical protein